ncbi:M23 family metallopeptidase [Cohnella pontilimi]|uniref:M23 family metallopeptidase n=2 Tax=Cohnella pontilimi TaxID=2564100 RepID=A0A4U0FCR8_9BACL|nr:M23 family metallopeptidase [Cohnella pontilimi]
MSAAKPSGWKKLLSKRWVFPAAYMAAAAIIVTILWLNAGNQGKGSQQDVSSVNSGVETNGKSSPESKPVAVNGETLQWPVAKFESFKTEMAFYDENASEDQRQAAMVEYDNKFMPHTGVDLAKNGKDFEVLAALSGKVTYAQETPTNGYEVHIQHANDIETVYQSLKDLQVKVGDEVKQGDAIAKAGTSQLEAGEGTHVHFEVWTNGEPVNPRDMIKAQ